jgi:Zn-finger nucleic acid-binding protein
VQREATRACPVDGTPLAPEHRSGIALDRCPSCEGVWLDAGELDVVIRAASSLVSGRSDRVADLLVDVFTGASDKVKRRK